jgi:hypothetical protein
MPKRVASLIDVDNKETELCRTECCVMLLYVIFITQRDEYYQSYYQELYKPLKWLETEIKDTHKHVYSVLLTLLVPPNNTFIIHTKNKKIHL